MLTYSNPGVFPDRQAAQPVPQVQCDLLRWTSWCSATFGISWSSFAMNALYQRESKLFGWCSVSLEVDYRLCFFPRTIAPSSMHFRHVVDARCAPESARYELATPLVCCFTLTSVFVAYCADREGLAPGKFAAGIWAGCLGSVRYRCCRAAYLGLDTVFSRSCCILGRMHR